MITLKIQMTKKRFGTKADRRKELPEYNSVRRLHYETGSAHIKQANAEEDSNKESESVKVSQAPTSLTYKLELSDEDRKKAEEFLNRFEDKVTSNRKQYHDCESRYLDAKASVFSEFGYDASAIRLKDVDPKVASTIRKRMAKLAFYYWESQMTITIDGVDDPVKSRICRSVSKMLPFAGFVRTHKDKSGEDVALEAPEASDNNSDESPSVDVGAPQA